MNKQQAINLLKNLEQSLDDYCELNDEGKTAFRMAITALNCSEFPNSSDTISRQAAIDALRTMQTYKLFAGDDMLLIDQAGAQTELMILPSAQPERKTGHWILDRSGAYCCSKCMEPCATYAMMKPRDKFCKMCGSRNEVME